MRYHSKFHTRNSVDVRHYLVTHHEVSAADIPNMLSIATSIRFQYYNAENYEPKL